MRVASVNLIAVSLLFTSALSWGQSGPCDLNLDGKVNVVDGQQAVNMSLKLLPCTANIIGPNVCDNNVVSRVVTAALGGGCNTHYVSLSWTASTSPNIAGYNVYRGSAAGGPYAKVNSSLVVGTSYTDASAVSGQTYYYVATAVNTASAESGYSTESRATVP